MRLLAVFGLLVLNICSTQNSTGASDSQRFVSTGKTVLVELFTSEGCSSCPPADAWFASLKTGLWTEFVPVVFHVDYWNHLGWKDVFSNDKFSDRQSIYAQSWNQRSVYTPAVVKDGEPWDGWRRGKRINQSKDSPGTLTLDFDASGTFAVSYDSSEQGCMTGAAAYMVREHSTKVLSGENKGSTLKHGFAAIDLTYFPLAKVGRILTGKSKFDSVRFPNAKSYAVAAWVRRCNDSHPVQAVGGELR